ncbi:Unknown protein [Striga hermonthica]|uniref:Uncharacterized protein n=1 Tax=Striga hermonthica TaxID=68872 RepID=A0A9N7R764_STRHE|nr:Unknown protein [Striga hermonthica]
MLSDMKIHPEPNKLNVALSYEVDSSILAQSNGCRQKNLRRLPHIFQKVLELPFHWDTDISISETPDSFRFSAAANHIGGSIIADTVEICPGVTKIVVKGAGIFESTGLKTSSICGDSGCRIWCFLSTYQPSMRMDAWW